MTDKNLAPVLFGCIYQQLLGNCTPDDHTVSNFTTWSPQAHLDGISKDPDQAVVHLLFLIPKHGQKERKYPSMV
jgi:hypothetical protein